MVETSRNKELDLEGHYILNYVKKLEGITQAGLDKILANVSNIGNHCWCYSKVYNHQSYSAHSIKLAFPTATVVPAKAFY